jgi:hypothetical protein
MKRLVLITLIAVGLSTPSAASPITFTGASGNLAASVSFEVKDSTLEIILTNTSLVGALVPSDILTAVFFDLTDFTGGLDPYSAVLNTGSSVLNGVSDPGGVVGGEWAYAEDIEGAPGGQSYGIGSAGLDIFGVANFTGTNLDGPDAVNGLGYGIMSAVGITADANPKIKSTPLISNSVIFTLSGLPLGFSLATTAPSNIYFQYGTSLSEPRVSVPEPATLLLLLPGLGAVVAERARSRRKKAASTP